MPFDFDRAPRRIGTDSIKWDAAEAFGVAPGEDLIPMWIADMDFYAAPEVLEAINGATAPGLVGYRRMGERFYDGIVGWMKKRHDVDLSPDAILPIPGVIPGISAAIAAFTAPGDGVIIQPPVYPPFFGTPRGMGRVVLENRLIECEADGILSYRVDFDGLRALAARPEAKLMILCSPHNPLGRVWTAEELATVCRICAENGVFLVCDEIHADITFGKTPFTPILRAAAEAGLTRGFIALGSPSKSFNVAGTHTAYLIAPDAGDRAALRNFFESMHLPESSYVSADVIAAAYGKAAYYPDELAAYIRDNMAAAAELLATVPGLRMTAPEATYLLWADLRNCGIPPEKVVHLLAEQGRVIVNEGAEFAPDRVGCVRINVGAPRAMMLEGIRRIVDTLRAAQV